MARRAPVSPLQRTSGAAFALFILLQTPLLTYRYKVGEGHYRDEPISPLEIVGIYVFAVRPELGPVAQTALFPGVWFKELSKEGFTCVARKPECNLGRLTNLGGAWQKADYSQKVQAYENALGPALGIINAACGILVLAALSHLFAPASQVKLLLVGLALMSWAILRSGGTLTPLPTSIFMGMLAFMGAMPPTDPGDDPRVAAARAKERLVMGDFKQDNSKTPNGGSVGKSGGAAAAGVAAGDGPGASPGGKGGSVKRRK